MLAIIADAAQAAAEVAQVAATAAGGAAANTTDWPGLITSLGAGGLAVAILWYLLKTVIPKMEERHSEEQKRQRDDFKGALETVVSDAKEAREAFQSELAEQRNARIESTKTQAESSATLARLCDSVETLNQTMQTRVRQATRPHQPAARPHVVDGQV